MVWVWGWQVEEPQASPGPQKYVEEWPFGQFLEALGCFFTYFWGFGLLLYILFGSRPHAKAVLLRSRRSLPRSRLSRPRDLEALRKLPAHLHYPEGPGTFLDPKSMWNNGPLGSFFRLWAIILHTFGSRLFLRNLGLKAMIVMAFEA